MKKFLLSLLSIGIFFAFTACSSGSSTPTPVPTVSVDKTLTSGFYFVGVDIPAGTYNFTAVTGSGVLFSNDIEMNTNIDAKGSEYPSSYNNVVLKNGDVFQVRHMTVKVASNNASGTQLTARSQSIKDPVTLNSGTFVAGTDFTAGTYDIKVTKGNGSASDDAASKVSLNVIMGVSTEYSYDQEFKNVQLDKGVTLTLSSISVVLTPSK